MFPPVTSELQSDGHAAGAPSPAPALLDRGYTSEVRAWGQGRVLKLFHDWVPRPRIEREFQITRAVHAAGLPVAAAHELIAHAGRHGIVFERIDGHSLFARVQQQPWRLFQAVRDVADLQFRVHHCPCPPELPSQRTWILDAIAARTDLTEAEKETARRHLAALPDSNAICHGDFHPGNILLSARGPIIIDWETATRGNPLCDCACTSRLLERAGLPPWSPRWTHWLLAISRALLHRTYLKRCLGLHGATREQLEAWKAPLSAARKLRFSRLKEFERGR
jgi:uncharacterized protein (TIGR02172 family)